MFQGFLDLDQAMLEENMQGKVAGSTAVIVLVKDNTLYCGNVGDSRAIASVRGAVSRFNNTMTIDFHNLILATEKIKFTLLG